MLDISEILEFNCPFGDVQMKNGKPVECVLTSVFNPGKRQDSAMIRMLAEFIHQMMEELKVSVALIH